MSRQVKLIVDCGGSVVYLCPPFYLFRGEFSKEKATPSNPNFGPISKTVSNDGLLHDSKYTRKVGIVVGDDQ